jgi:hypothetical protein
MPDSGRRACVLCGLTHGRDAFSDFQWGEGRLAKCTWCVRGQPQPARPQPSAGQRAAAAMLAAQVSSADVEHSALRASARGRAVSFSGGGPCVAKWYRDAPMSYEDDGLPIQLGDRSLLRGDVKVAQRTTRILDEWNSTRLVEGMVLRLATSQLMRVASAGKREGTHVLVEASRAHARPLLKVNSNSGWSVRNGDDPVHAAPPPRRTQQKQQPTHHHSLASSPTEQHVAAALDALSHYSYHTSGGEVLLCNLSASWEARGAAASGGALSGTGDPQLEVTPMGPLEVTLSDVCLLSRGATYGPTDLGVDGMRHWFGHHVCSQHCRREWLRPADAAPVYHAAERRTVLVQPMALPARITPPVRHDGGASTVGAHRGGGRARATLVSRPTDAEDESYEVDVAAAAHERRVMAAEARHAATADAHADAARARAAAAALAAALATETADAADAAARLEAFNGINGITGLIGRRPTTQQPRPTVTEVLYHGSWKDIPPLTELMEGPNDGTYFTEPAE